VSSVFNGKTKLEWRVTVVGRVTVVDRCTELFVVVLLLLLALHTTLPVWLQVMRLYNERLLRQTRPPCAQSTDH